MNAKRIWNRGIARAAEGQGLFAAPSECCCMRPGRGLLCMQ